MRRYPGLLASMGENRFDWVADAATQAFYAHDPRVAVTATDPSLSITVPEVDDGERPGVRRMLVNYDWPGLSRWHDLVRPVLEPMVIDLDVFRGPAELSGIQLTKSTEGSFFARHTDAAQHPGPIVAFVYYLGLRATFEGGVLRFDEGDIIPHDDLLVVFDGNTPHEVTRVDRRFGVPDYMPPPLRLTINGYYR